MNKQIEEMAKVIDVVREPIPYDNGKMVLHLFRTSNEIAEALYNAGYRKVGDNEVVIDKGFFDDLIAGNVTMYIKETDNIIISKEEYKNSRKETAREILQPLYENALNSPDYTADYHISDIQELAEEFGIEVE